LDGLPVDVFDAAVDLDAEPDAVGVLLGLGDDVNVTDDVDVRVCVTELVEVFVALDVFDCAGELDEVFVDVCVEDNCADDVLDFESVAVFVLVNDAICVTVLLEDDDAANEIGADFVDVLVLVDVLDADAEAVINALLSTRNLVKLGSEIACAKKRVVNNSLPIIALSYSTGLFFLYV
jgi:hypothetical protein